MTPELAGANAAVARRGAERLGWSHGYLRRNARGCVGSGVCAFGCPTAAKQHTGITYVPRAKAAGARDRHRRRVQRVVVRERARTGGAGAMASGARLRSARRSWWLAAGHDPHAPLLARSGLGSPSGELGRTSVAPRHRHLRADGRGRGHGPRRAPELLRRRVRRARGSCSRASRARPYVAMSLPLTGPRHADAMADYPRLAQFGLMVSDSLARVGALAVGWAAA